MDDLVARLGLQIVSCDADFRRPVAHPGLAEPVDSALLQGRHVVVFGVVVAPLDLRQERTARGDEDDDEIRRTVARAWNSSTISAEFSTRRLGSAP